MHFGTQIRRLLYAILFYIGSIPVAFSQQFDTNTDPTDILSQLISAFQNCGPPNVYQMLSPQLFQVIFVQTGGAGCYQAIAAAGPVTDMETTDVKELPAGPVFSVRVTHQNGQLVDWFIGLSNFSGRIEYLSFAAASQQSVKPSIAAGPKGGGKIPPVVDPNTPTSACTRKWGTMCQ